MSDNEKRAKARIAVAKETMEEADSLIALKKIRGSVNRLYYAGFYAVTSYLFFVDIHEATHKRVRIQFNLLLARPQLVAKPAAKLFNELASIRNDSDYHDFNEISMDDVVAFRKSVRSIIDSVDKLIEG